MHEASRSLWSGEGHRCCRLSGSNVLLGKAAVLQTTLPMALRCSISRRFSPAKNGGSGDGVVGAEGSKMVERPRRLLGMVQKWEEPAIAADDEIR